MNNTILVDETKLYDRKGGDGGRGGVAAALCAVGVALLGGQECSGLSSEGGNAGGLRGAGLGR